METQNNINSSDAYKILEKMCSRSYVDDIIAIKKKLKSGGQGFALDIDETLSATNIAWFEIMFQKFGNPENLTPQEAATKYGLAQNPEYFQNKPEIDAWMHTKREDDEFQKNIPLIENANEIYKEIHEKNINISLYITARPSSVKSGTESWLKNHGFPGAGIILRPKELDHKNSNLWKACILEILYPEIQGIVDDNTELLKYISSDYKGLIYMYTHDRDFGKENVIGCSTHKAIKNHLSKIYKI